MTCSLTTDSMTAKDIMSRGVLTVPATADVEHVAHLMVKGHVSGLPVIAADGGLAGIVTEGDLLRRVELATDPKESLWHRLFTSKQHLAKVYFRSHSRRAADIMTAPVKTITEATPLGEIAELLEHHGFKQMPVLRGTALVGMVARVDLVRVLLMTSDQREGQIADRMIRDHFIAALREQPWNEVHEHDVIVANGVVYLWGAVTNSEVRTATRVAAENIPGVRAVQNNLTVPETLV